MLHPSINKWENLKSLIFWQNTILLNKCYHFAWYSKIYSCSILILVQRLLAKLCPSYFKWDGTTNFGAKMHLRVESSNWLGAMWKVMLELFPGQFLFFVHMFACEVENLKFIVWVTPIGRPQEDEKLDIQIWFDCICACTLQCLPWWKLFLISVKSPAITPRVLCTSSNCVFIRYLLICVTHSMNSKCKFFSWQAFTHTGDESKRSPPRNGFDVDFRKARNQFDFSVPKYICVPSFMLSSNFEQFLWVTFGLYFFLWKISAYIMLTEPI